MRIDIEGTASVNASAGRGALVLAIYGELIIQSSFTKMIPQQNDTFYFNFRNSSIRENDTFSKMILFEDLFTRIFGLFQFHKTQNDISF